MGGWCSPENPSIVRSGIPDVRTPTQGRDDAGTYGGSRRLHLSVRPTLRMAPGRCAARGLGAGSADRPFRTEYGQTRRDALLGVAADSPVADRPRRSCAAERPDDGAACLGRANLRMWAARRARIWFAVRVGVCRHALRRGRTKPRFLAQTLDRGLLDGTFPKPARADTGRKSAQEMARMKAGITSRIVLIAALGGFSPRAKRLNSTATIPKARSTQRRTALRVSIAIEVNDRGGPPELRARSDRPLFSFVHVAMRGATSGAMNCLLPGGGVNSTVRPG